MIAVLAVAAMLTGQPTQLTGDMTACPPAAYGCADIPGRIIHMREDLAGMLPRLEAIQPYQAALAVLVFCHEARHVRGTTSERVAERWAIAHATTVARLLGASKEWVARMRPYVKVWDSRLAA